MMTLTNILLAIGVGIWQGVVLAAMWGWFVVPLGLPAINWQHAAGMALLLMCATMSVKRDEADIDSFEFAAGQVAGAATMLLILGAAWLLKLGVA